MDWSGLIKTFISDGIDEYAEEYNIPVSELQICIKTDDIETCSPIYILRTNDNPLLKEIKVSDLADMSGAMSMLSMFINADTINEMVNPYIAQFIYKISIEENIEPQNVRLILKKKALENNKTELKSYLFKLSENKNQFVCEIELQRIMEMFKQ